MRASPTILVAGSLNLDQLLHVSRLPVAGETQAASTYTRLPGGKGANQAAAAARLGTCTTMLGCVGEDDAGRMLLAALREAGVETRFILPGKEPTGTATILLTPSGDNSIVIAPGANALLSPAYVQQCREQIATAGMVLTQLETPTASLEALLEVTQAAGVPLMLDPAPAARLSPPILTKLTWFTPNETEAAFYLNDSAAAAETANADHLRAVCERFRQIGPRNILLKLGRRGACVLTESGEFFHAAAPKVEAVDTTGAGDTCNAAFAVSLLRGHAIEHALRYAVAAASLSVTRVGAMAASPTAAEVDRLLRQAPRS